MSHSKFRINPLNREQLLTGLLSRSSQVGDIGPAEIVRINRKWIAGNSAWLEICQENTSFLFKYSVLWITQFDSHNYVLIQEEPPVDNDGVIHQFVLRIIDQSTLFTLDAQRLKDVTKVFEDAFETRAPWTETESAQYFGDLPLYGSPEYKAQAK